MSTNDLEESTPEELEDDDAEAHIFCVKCGKVTIWEDGLNMRIGVYSLWCSVCGNKKRRKNNE
jgi:hypothetical protein